VVIVKGELNGRYSCILFSMSAGAPYTQTLPQDCSNLASRNYWESI